ncbi:MAG TPA: SDR family oxidoreductase [Balneolaceae bacterium]|nr:SDR family oxidoreductase [Balneolaceae bacterium]
MKTEKKLAIVTGASRGIGLAISKILTDNGMMVAGLSRNAPDDFSHPNFLHFETDLTIEESVDETVQKIHDSFAGPVSVLINNAGVGYRGNLEDTPSDRWRYLFDLNVHGLFYVSKRIIPEMKETKNGHIINISSGAGTNGISGMSAYCGTKHAVVGITESMHQEVRDFGVKATCLSPGSVDTGFSSSKKNKLLPEDLAKAVLHIIQCPQNFHYTDIQVRPLQP